MQKIRKILLSLFICGALASFLFAPAASAAFLSPAEIQAQIKQITEQIKLLSEQLAKLAAPQTKTSLQFFSSNLWFGMQRNPDVERLQEFLISRGYLAKGLVTGNFLSLTRAAVREFQEDSGMPATGFFGPLTRARVNSIIESDFLSLYALLPKPAYDLSGLAKLIYGAVNVERAESGGLPLLVWDDAIANVARAHSEDQARDNIALTNPDLPCAYPFIRHEGFLRGLFVGDRLSSARVPFRIAGENIITFSSAKNLVYIADAPVPVCAQIENGEPSSRPSTLFEAQTRIAQEIQKRRALISKQSAVKWINRDWLTQDEIAGEAAKDWMKSEGHKKNIVNPEFVKTGIGIAQVNDYLVITQVFTGHSQ